MDQHHCPEHRGASREEYQRVQFFWYREPEDSGTVEEDKKGERDGNEPAVRFLLLYSNPHRCQCNECLGSGCNEMDDP